MATVNPHIFLPIIYQIQLESDLLLYSPLWFFLYVCVWGVLFCLCWPLHMVSAMIHSIFQPPHINTNILPVPYFPLYTYLSHKERVLSTIAILTRQYSWGPGGVLEKVHCSAMVYKLWYWTLSSIARPQILKWEESLAERIPFLAYPHFIWGSKIFNRNLS